MTGLEADALTEEQRTVLEMIYRLFRETGDWPKWGDVYRQLRRAHRFAVSDVYKSIPDTYVQRSTPVPNEPHQDEPARLTLRGIETCSGGAEDIERLTLLLQWFAELEREYEPANGERQPTVTAEQVRDHLGIKSADGAALGRLRTMLDISNWGTSPRQYVSPAEWSVLINPDIYRFENAESIYDVLNARADWLAKDKAALLGPRPDPLGRPLTAATFGYAPVPQSESSPDAGEPYVDVKITDALRGKIDNGKFDLAKLLALIDELNDNYASKNTYSCLALQRAIMDHVPPILGCKSFDEVASGYAGWGRTDKSYMQNLARVRKNGDDALHRQISEHTDLLSMDDVPSRVWVNVLLRECATKL
jgi:hypothetical protein